MRWEMNSDANVSRSWYASSLSQLKRIASHIIEAVSPNLFWRLKVRGLRRNLSEDELRIAPLLCDLSKISVDIGSSLGPYAVNICNYSANCIAFEPRPVQAARIMTRINGKRMIIVKRC